MSDIRAGDVVVCVANSGSGNDEPETSEALARLVIGRTYRVQRIGLDVHGNEGIDIGLRNDDIWHGFNNVWPPKLFRKLRPADPEFIAQMSRITLHGEPVE